MIFTRFFALLSLTQLRHLICRHGTIFPKPHHTHSKHLYADRLLHLTSTHHHRLFSLPFFCVHKTSSLVETKNKSRYESGCGYRKTERERERQVQIHSQTIQFDSAVYLASGI